MWTGRTMLCEWVGWFVDGWGCKRGCVCIGVGGAGACSVGGLCVFSPQPLFIPTNPTQHLAPTHPHRSCMSASLWQAEADVTSLIVALAKRQADYDSRARGGGSKAAAAAKKIKTAHADLAGWLDKKEAELSKRMGHKVRWGGLVGGLAGLGWKGWEGVGGGCLA